MKATVTAPSVWAPTAGTYGVTQDTGDTERIVFTDPLPVDLYVYRGDSGRFRVAITSPDGTPLDVTTATWDCDVRQGFDAPDPVVSLTVNPIDAYTIEVVLDPLMSAMLIDGAVWDLEMTLGGEVQTLMAGAVHVHKDVSRT